LARKSDPGPVAGDGALEGLDLANIAAAQTRAQTVIKAVDAVLTHIARNGLGVGTVERQAPLVALLQALEQGQSLIGQTAGIDAEYVYFPHLRADQIGQDHGLRTQAAGVDHATELGHGPVQQRHGGIDLGSLKGWVDHDSEHCGCCSHDFGV